MTPLVIRLVAALAVCTACLPSAATERLQIGLGAPLSGIDSGYGRQLRLGVEEAVRDINADGGFLGRQGEVVLGDDAGDPKKGVNVARRFVSSGIKLVVGHFSSAVTVPASAVYGEAKALDIAPAAEAPVLTERGFTTVFRTCGREDQQAAVAARFLGDRHYTKIAILYDRSSIGKKVADDLRKALSARGASSAFYGSIPDGVRDLGPIVSRIKASGTQIVFWSGGAQGAAQLVRQLADSHIPLLGGFGIASDDFATAAGAAADGTFVVFPKDPRRQPAAAALLKRLKSRNISPDGYTFYAYAAVQIIRQAAEAAQSLDPERLAAAMHADRRFQTVLGPITYNRYGDPNVSDLTVYLWHKGPSGRMEFLDPANS